MKRLIATLLCIAMLTALCGCGSGSTPTTVPPTTTEPAPQAADAYAEAAAKLEALENVELEITYIEEMTLGDSSFKTTTRQTVTELGIGTDAFAAFTQEEHYTGSLRVYTDETYLGGTVYSQMNYDYYRSDMTAEDYAARLLPAVLLDETLYETVEQTSDTEFTFTGAEVLESWCDNPYATLDSVTATAKLGEDGLPAKYTYKAEFAQGAADMSVSVTVDVRTPELTEIAVPAGADSFLVIDDIDAPFLVIMAAGYLEQATALLSTNSETVVSQAAGFTETAVTTMAAHGKDATQIGVFDTTYLFADLSAGTSEGYTMQETFCDGALTTVIDGGEPEITQGYTGYDMQDAVDAEVLYLVPALSTIAGFELSVMGDTALLEYTFTEDTTLLLEQELCTTYFGDGNILRADASNVTINEHGGCIGIDLTTGMPLALGQTLTMTHTIDGQDYVLSSAQQSSVQLGAKDAYETITGEKLPLEEPAEKATPVFYKVTGEGGKQMWLLGTIHVGDERTAFLPQEIYDAFASSDALAVEFETESYTASLMEDPEAIQAYIQALLYTDGTTLKDHIQDEKLYEDTLKLLRATGNFTNEATILLTKPVFHFQTLQNYFMGNGFRLSGDFGVDHQLEQLAYEQEKEILSVESGEFQMDLLGDLSDELQELMLKDTVEYGQFAYNHGTEELFELWCTGDEAALIAYLTEEEDDSDLTEEEKALYAEYENALGGNRNVDMLAVAKDYLSSGKTVFYAVGLAHLLAKDGLVNTLRDAGYTVELVSYAG